MRKNRTFFIFLVGMLLVSPGLAVDVVMIDDTLVVQDVQESLGLGGFHIILRHSDSLAVNDVEGIAPFIVSPNIQPGYVDLAGIQASELLTGDIPVARVVYSGNGSFTIEVSELINSAGDPLGMGIQNEPDDSTNNQESDSGDIPTVSQIGNKAIETKDVPATEIPTSEQLSESQNVSEATKLSVDSNTETESPETVNSTKEPGTVRPTQASLPVMITILGLIFGMVLQRKL